MTRHNLSHYNLLLGAATPQA